MQLEADPGQKKAGLGTHLLTLILRIALPIAILAAAFAVMYWGFIFLRESAAPKWLIVLVAIVGASAASPGSTGFLTGLSSGWVTRGAHDSSRSSLLARRRPCSSGSWPCRCCARSG